jgi:hypothetical protein
MEVAMRSGAVMISDGDLDRLMRPWGNIAPGFWDNGSERPPQAPQAPPVSVEPAAVPPKPPRPPAPSETATAAVLDGPPPEYAARVAAVSAALGGDPGDLRTAVADAEQLDGEITARYGAAHPHTVNVREIRGWLELQRGDAAAATRWFLHTTDLQCQVWGTRHQVTQASAARAVHAWSAITEPEVALVLGESVVDILARTAGEQAEVTKRARRKLTKVGSAAAAQRPGLGVDRPAVGGS